MKRNINIVLISLVITILLNTNDALSQILVCGHPTDVDAVVFSRDSKQLVTSSSEYLYIWDISSKSLKDTIHSDYVKKIVFDPKGDYFATGKHNMSRLIKVWEFNNRKPLKIIKRDGNESFDIMDNYLIVSHDSKRITFENILSDSSKICEWDYKFSIWDLVTSRNRKYLAIQGYKELDNYKKVYHFEIRNLISGDMVGTFKVPQSEKIRTIEVCALSSNGEYFAWSSKNHVYLYSTNPVKLKDDFSCSEGVESMDFSPDSKSLAIGQQNGQFAIYYNDKGRATTIEVSNFNKMFSHIMKGSRISIYDGNIIIFPEYQKRNQWVQSIAFSDDGELLALGCSNYAIIIPGNLIFK